MKRDENDYVVEERVFFQVKLSGIVQKACADGSYDVYCDLLKRSFNIIPDDMEKEVKTSFQRYWGPKIEANLHGEGIWFEGRVTGELSDGTFEITFDDGLVERGVPSECIRMRGAGTISDEKVYPRGQTSPFKKLSPSTPSRKNRREMKGPSAGRSDESLQTLRQRCIQAIGSKKFDKIFSMLVYFKESLASSTGRGNDILETKENVYSILGESHAQHFPLIEQFMDQTFEGNEATKQPNSLSSSFRGQDALYFQSNAHIEVNYQGKGNWYPGKITRDRNDGTFDVLYDDGEVEVRVEQARIRAQTVLPAFPVQKYWGPVIEANSRGCGKWLRGRVTGEFQDGSFEVTYDTGEIEEGVTGDCIRIRGTKGRATEPVISESNKKLLDSRLEQSNKAEVDGVEHLRPRSRNGDHSAEIIERPRSAKSRTNLRGESDGVEASRVHSIERVDRPRSANSRANSRAMSSGDSEFGEGRVMVNYKGRGKWFPGKIDRARNDGTFDILFDGTDEKELRVQRGLIQFLSGKQKAESRPGLTSDGDDDDEFSPSNDLPVETRGFKSPRKRLDDMREGVRCDVNSNGKWLSAIIDRVRKDGSFDVVFDGSGEREVRVDQSMIRSREQYDRGRRDDNLSNVEVDTHLEPSLHNIKSRSGLVIGLKVKANYAGRGKWYPGKIVNCSENDFDVLYVDGELETNIPAIRIRAIENLLTSEMFAVGDPISANYRCRGTWYPGTIARMRDDGTYDIEYDDGEREAKVDADMIRLLMRSSVRNSKHKVPMSLD